MNLDPQTLRLDGIYQMAGEDRWMQRIKVPAGALASEQAVKVAALAEQYASGRLHLTSRCSIELHAVRSADLAEVNRGLARVGLTGRGACGGAVRGISCSTSFSENYLACQALARKLQRHFVGNAAFEGLPKKFKIGIDGNRRDGRHLIQDAGLVYAGQENGELLWDVWCAGGLGKEPQAGFLLGERIPEGRLIALLEGLVTLYRERVERPKRLKHLRREVGEEEFRSLLRQSAPERPRPLTTSGLGETLTPQAESFEAPLLVPVAAGELSARQLRLLGGLASDYAEGILVLTADQDIALHTTNEKDRTALQQRLNILGLGDLLVAPQPCFRVCPGSDECRRGLSATREIALQVSKLLGPVAQDLRLAISGCRNSCSQPQLADLGIVTTRLSKTAEGHRQPRFSLLRRQGEGLGEAVVEDLGLQELLNKVKEYKDEFPAGK